MTRSTATLHDLWRGAPWPKNLHLLDNDFFGQGEWRERLAESMAGKYKLCFNQGINLRTLTDEQAAWLALTEYRDDQFQKRRLYTAWDNLGDERVFKRGVETLTRAGIPAGHLMVYMLIGFRGGPDDPNKLNQPETEAEVLYRFNELVALGCLPYPMLYDRSNKRLKMFQRWALRRYYKVCKWEEFDPKKSH